MAAADISFNRDVRPALAEACFECHGPAKAKAGLRLDLESSAKSPLKSGNTALVPGHPEKSELLRRITTKSSDDQMPPPETGKPPLTPQQVAALDLWIRQGATWDQHWAFKPITRPPIPPAVHPSLARNPIDAFIQKGLADRGLAPAPRASDRILRRRLAFDLTGLPPQRRQFGLSWEKQAEVLLASPGFGERMAVWWLDLVRYSDSEGYFADSHRNVYPYRDYVIRSFNANKRFDRFTTEQLAGDLLPGAGWEEKIGSGYNRLNRTTHEDGANAAEYRAKYAADRVRNLGSVWMGLTLGCAQCHDHKFDPVSALDFYRTAAFFADIKEAAVRTQSEVYTGISDPGYRDNIAKTEAIRRIQAAGSPETVCAQIIAESAYLRDGTIPDRWPPSAKTKLVLALIHKKADGKTSPSEDATIARYFARHFLNGLHAQLIELNKARASKEAGRPRSLITEPGPVRIVRALPRGDWTDSSGPTVSPGFLLESPGDDNSSEERMNRLHLSQWLLAPNNPLTARVTVNRLWRLCFGAGLSRNLDDFGAQGDPPANPELLDWLASEFIASGWDVKRLLRLIVTSHTYQQVAPASGAPDDGLFATQSRFQLQAEFIRNNILSTAGLLSRAQFGQPVKPYLPPGFLDNIDTLGEDPYVPDRGERLYRRGVYLYHKRTFLHPTLAAFNASSREECVSERAESQIPHQALALLNAPAFVEAARAFGERMHLAARNDDGRIRAGYAIALDREPSSAELAVLTALLASQRASYSADEIGAAQSIRTGNYRWPKNMEAVELAAWTDVARAILNLDELNQRP